MRRLRGRPSLVSCSKCGQAGTATAVLTPANLDHQAGAVLCNDCSRPALPASFSKERPHLLDVAGLPEALEWTADGATERVPAGTVTNGSERHRAVEVEVDRLDEVVEHQGGSVSADPHPLGSASETLASSQDEMGRRLAWIGERLADETERNNRRHDAMEARLLEMQAGFASVLGRIARLESNETRIQEPRTMDYEPDLVRIEEQLNDRLDRLAERAARRGAGDDRRLLAIESAVGDVARRIAELAETQRAELEVGFRDGLTEIRAAANGETGRLEVLEDNLAQIRHEMSQLGDLQAVLDGGLGQLRSRLVELTNRTKSLALGQATLDERLQGLAQVQPPVSVDRRRPLPRSGAPAETGAEMMVDRPPVAGHAGLEDKQLKAQLAMLEHMTDAVLTASSDTCDLEHLGNDVRALAEQLAAHDAALARLSRRDERPRDRVPNEPAAPKSTRHGSSS